MSKQFSRKRIMIGFGLFAALFLFVFVAFEFLSENRIDRIASEQAAKRWAGEGEPYGQISVFYAKNQKMQASDISGLYSDIMMRLSEDGYVAEPWIYAYSGESRIELWKDKETLSVTAVGVGGDFFQFHTEPLLGGTYFSAEDLNQDRIVIDENVAWKLFGSNDVAGMKLWIGNRVYDVAGVVKVPEQAEAQVAYGTYNRVYMPYDSLQTLDETLSITCFEAVLPEPIQHYGYNVMAELLGVQQEEENESPVSYEDFELVENSDRYHVLALLKLWKNKRLAVMKTNSICYPFWENIARVEAERMKVLLLFKLIFGALGALCAAICLGIFIDEFNRQHPHLIRRGVSTLVEEYRIARDKETLLEEPEEKEDEHAEEAESEAEPEEDVEEKEIFLEEEAESEEEEIEED